MKRILPLTMVLFLNGSFAPKGGGEVQYLSANKAVQERMAYKMAVMYSKFEHEQRLRLCLVVAQDNHNRTVDSLNSLLKNTKP